MDLIDVHTHIMHPKIAEKATAQLEGHYGIRPKGTGMAEDLLTRMDTGGIHRAVVHTAATAPAQVIPANNWVLEVKERFDRFIPFGTVHPGYEKWEQELDRLEERGISGIKLHPDFQGIWLNDPALYPLLEAVQGRFIVMVHVGDDLPPEKNPSCPRKLAGVLDKFPGLTVIAAHLGGYRQWDLALEFLAGRDVYVDTSSSLPFIPSDLLAKIVNRHSRERLLFGSDYPLFDPGGEWERLRNDPVFDSGLIREMQRNAQALFEVTVPA
jgi:hypothetical protein